MFYDGSLPTDADMLEFLASEDGTDPTTYSFYGNLYDAIKCATKTHPSLNGEKGNIQAQFIEGSETQFKSFATLDLPTGSPGDITGSIDVTLTVTDDQGLTDTDTQTITYALPLLGAPEVSDAEIRIYEDSTKTSSVLEAPIVIGATASYTISGEPEVAATTNSASGSELTNYTTITGKTSANTYSATTGGASSLTSSFDQNYY